MTLNEARKILTLWDKGELTSSSNVLIKATKLGVESIKEVQRLRIYKGFVVKSQLKGETVD